MRILFDHQVFQLQRTGGASRLYFEILKRLSNRPGFEVSLFAGLHRSHFPIERLTAESFRFFGKRMANDEYLTFAAKANRLALPLYALGASADIYQPTYYVDALPLSKTPKVATVLDMIHEIYPKQFGIDRTTERKKELCHTAELIFSISEHTKQDLIEKFRVPAEKIRVIHLANSITPPATRLNFVDRPYVLYVGARAGYKNFNLLAKSFAASAALKDFELIAFGSGAFNGDEKRLLEDLKISTRVRQIPGDDDVLAQLYASAKVFVYPSLYEGFGIPPLEAMALGCPVIAARSSSIPEVCGDGALLFDPNSEEELKTALEKVVLDTALSTELIRRGTAREKTFSWDKTTDGLVKLYQELA